MSATAEQRLKDLGFSKETGRDRQGRIITLWSTPGRIGKRELLALSEAGFQTRPIIPRGCFLRDIRIVVPLRRHRRRFRPLPGDIVAAACFAGFAAATAIAQAMGWLEWLL